MELVGELLRRNRLEQNIKIVSVCNDLKVSKDIISKIESDNFPEYLSEVFLIGHIRSYAKYLDLDENLIVKNFKLQRIDLNKSPKDYITKPLAQTHKFQFSHGFSLVSIFFVSIGFYFLFIKSNDLQPEFSITSDLNENLQTEVEQFEMDLTLKSQEIEKEEIERIANNFYNIAFENIQSTQTSAIASAPNENDLTSTVNTITLKFIEPTWIQLRDKKENVIISKLMKKNEELTYSNRDEYFLTAGNAGNIFVFVDGISRGKVGKKGEVVESLFINSEFSN